MGDGKGAYNLRENRKSWKGTIEQIESVSVQGQRLPQTGVNRSLLELERVSEIQIMSV